MGWPMPVETVQLFYAILSLVALGVVGAVLILRLLATVSPSARRTSARTAGALALNGVAMAWIVAMLATAGSLYFSEIAHYDPCRLCWFQRIPMYPLAIILGIAAFRRDDGIRSTDVRSPPSGRSSPPTISPSSGSRPSTPARVASVHRTRSSGSAPSAL